MTASPSGHRIRLRGPWTFAWLDDAAWDRHLAYAEDSLVSDVTLTHARLGISVRFEDYVDLARNWFIRNVEVSSANGFTTGRAFFHYDWYIEGSDIGNTVAFEPRHRGIIAYKANRYFLIGGRSGPDFGIGTWANGKKGNGLPCQETLPAAVRGLHNGSI